MASATQDCKKKKSLVEKILMRSTSMASPSSGYDLYSSGDTIPLQQSPKENQEMSCLTKTHHVRILENSKDKIEGGRSATAGQELNSSGGYTALPSSSSSSLTSPPQATSAADSVGGADKSKAEEQSDTAKMTPAQAKRAAQVKKSIKYFENKKNRSMSEDNLFTRRKNLAVHLGLDETVGIREVQKINTYCLPVPSSATAFDGNDPQLPFGGCKISDEAKKASVQEHEAAPLTGSPSSTLVPGNLNTPRRVSSSAVAEVLMSVVEEDDDDEEDDIRTKNLVKFLGMKDGASASIMSQGTLSDGSPKMAPANSTLPIVSGSQNTKQQLAQVAAITNSQLAEAKRSY